MRKKRHMMAKVPKAHGSHEEALHFWLPVLILASPEAQAEISLHRQFIWEMISASRCEGAERGQGAKKNP